MSASDISHQELVTALAKPGDDIAKDIDGYKAHLLHMAIGLASEVGELLDALKRPVIYNKKWDYENLTEELGDIEFYLEGLRQGLSIKREVTLEANISKLLKRYDSLKYSDSDALARKDKTND